MGYLVRLLPSGVEFPADDNKTIIASALGSDIHLGHSCNNGLCGACKARLIEGVVSQQEGLPGLSDNDIANHYILTCKAEPRSNLVLEANYYPELSGIRSVVLPCKIDRLEFPVNDIAVLTLRLPPNSKFRFMPGQYIDLIGKGVRRSYSIANSCISASPSSIELHIRKVDNGIFSDFIFNHLKIGQLLRLEGPLGSFFLRRGNRKVIFVAGGTGFAPIKAMVEQIIEEQSSQEIYIYWGMRDSSSFYTNVALGWEEKYENIHYIPVVSDNGQQWSGRMGLVHKAVVEDFADLSEFDLYICGSPKMIEAARNDFLLHGADINNCYSDAFYASN